MTSQLLSLPTRAGLAPCHFFSPPDGGRHPAVIFLMDGIGIRPALCAMAARLASHGYHVLLPNLYYRAGPSRPFEAATAFQAGPERDRLMGLLKSINHQLIREDTADFLTFLDRQPHVAGPKVGCVGYCLGGGFALTLAGRFPDRIAAAASFHGARLATDQPDSPHWLAPQMRAEIYVGVAGIDPHFPPEEQQRLELALRTAGVRHAVEVYPNVKHGFAVDDTLAYDRPAAERHWQRLLKLFADNLVTQ